MNKIIKFIIICNITTTPFLWSYPKEVHKALQCIADSDPSSKQLQMVSFKNMHYLLASLESASEVLKRFAPEYTNDANYIKSMKLAREKQKIIVTFLDECLEASQRQ